MPEDWFLSRIAAVERAAFAASRELAEAPLALAQAREERLAGVPLAAIASELGASAASRRRQVAATYHKYEQAVSEMRADVVRALVDEEGITVSRLSDAMGISRQAVTRLYHASKKLSDT